MIALALLLAVAAPAPDACGALTPREIAAVQGAAPSQARPSERSDGEIVSQQCFFQLPDAARSVVLEVRRPAKGKSAAALRERWSKMAAPRAEREADREREHDREGEAERAGPRRIEGLGQGALWLGDRRAAALYVLSSKGAILRISVGGAASGEEKLAACKRLARRALARL